MADCQVCAGSVRFLRHSARWQFDVVRCRSCRTVAVADADQLAPISAPDADDDMNWDGYAEVMRDDERLRRDILAEVRRRLPRTLEKPVLFDVGAGDGGFLDLARSEGFDVAGNELSRSALAQARAKHDITLSPLLVGDQPAESADAMTMWCVVAHVPDAAQFLHEALTMLRPGAVLFLRTPRWCAIDTAGVALDAVSRGRLNALADRRVFPGHWRLFSAASISSLLRSVGFVDVEAYPTCHYGLKTDILISGTGGPLKSLRRASRLLDRAIERNWVPRNALMVYARRPMAASAA